MTTLLFSDTHLSNRVYRKKYSYLKKIIERHDRVIILGDLWDGFLTSFDGFVTSGWKELFPLLLEKQALYFYGNHDREEWSDERVTLFSVAQYHELDIEISGFKLHLMHGHAGVFVSLDERLHVQNHSLPLRIGASLDMLHKLVWGKRFLSSDSSINEPIKLWRAQHVRNNALVVTGHSHFPEKSLEEGILNPGFIGCGFGNYLSITEGRIELVKERYWKQYKDV